MSKGEVVVLNRQRQPGFTLIELLVSVAILTLLIGVLLPGLSNARKSAKASVCKTRLNNLGKGIVMYTDTYDDCLMPSRMPKIDDENVRVVIEGGLKYRPTFIAIMGSEVGVKPFNYPAPDNGFQGVPRERGDRQNYTDEAYLCPSVPDWTDERNGAYGYNYQFLGNSRLLDPANHTSYKNWPVKMHTIKTPGACVAVADCMGTAAAFPTMRRSDYDDTNFSPPADMMGNEGFNLDPPRLDVERGEVAEHDDGGKRSAADPRHRNLVNTLWLDGHVSAETLKTLGYEQQDDGVITLEGNNKFWHHKGLDRPWLQPGQTWP
jgi:prepilin-type N-terminal cleavage/methylation domain-containing protein/prepilin-type processing-associated H-X9-DG protein